MRIEVRDLQFDYPSGQTVTPVLEGLSFDVRSASVHAFVGPNGCGKSTLLRLLASLETPKGGTIQFIGERRHENVTALVFQDPRLIPWWNVERNLAISAEFSEKRNPLYSKVRDYHMQLLKLDKLAGRKPDQLSLGQQTMTGMGRGMAHDAEVLLLDEPFAHLDALNRNRLQKEFETHWQLDPRTIVLVTHDVDEAVMLSDRVSVMRAGAGPLVDTIEVDAGRPRSEVSPAHPGIRSATAWVWEALEKSL